MTLTETYKSIKLRSALGILRYSIYTAFFFLCLVFLFFQFVNLRSDFKLLAGLLGTGIAALTWLRSDRLIFGFVASIPLISGLQVHFSLSGKPIFELISAAIFVTWLARRLIFDRKPLSQISPVSGIVDAVAGIVIISLAATISRFPIDLLLDKLKSVSFYSLNGPLWCLGAAFLLLQGLFFYRILEMEIEETAIIKTAVRIFTIHALLVLSFSIYQWILNSPRLFYSNYGVYSPFDDAHSYGSYILFLFLFFLVFTFRQKAKRRLICTVLPIALLVLIVLSGSRATWVALGITGFGYFFLNYKRKFVFASIATIAALIIVISFLVQNNDLTQNPYLKRAGSLFYFKTLNEDTAVNRRSVLWHRAFNMISSFPLSGTGVGTFYRISTYFQNPEKNSLSEFHENTHNYYLQTAAELGIPATLLFLIIFYYTYRAAWMAQQANISQRIFIEGATLGLSGYLITLITGHALLIAKQQVLFWFVIAAITIPVYKSDTVKGQISQGRVAKFLLYGLMLLSIGAQIFQLFNSAPKPWNREYGFYDYENWQGEKMRWTWQRAIDSFVPDSNLIGFKLVAFPQNSNGPEGLTVRVSLDGKPWDEIHIYNGGVRPIYFYLPGAKNSRLEVGIEVNRTFNPRKMGMSSDNRNLGVAVSPFTSLKIMPLDGIGFYQPQTWEGDPWQGWPDDVPLIYRMSGKRATLNLSGKQLKDDRIYLKCTHPDIKIKPVAVSIEQGGKQIRKIVFDNTQAQLLELTPELLNETGYLTFAVDRTWNPRKMGISDDDHDLGVAVAILKKK